MLAVLAKAVGKPGHRKGGIIQHACAKPGFFHLAVARHNGPGPAWIKRTGAHGMAPGDDACVGSIVGNSIDDGSGFAGCRVCAQDAGIKDFQGWCFVICGIQHIGAGDARALQRRFQDEGQFHLDPWLDETVRRNVSPRCKRHIIHHHAGIGLADVQRRLHGFGG